MDSHSTVFDTFPSPPRSDASLSPGAFTAPQQQVLTALAAGASISAAARLAGVHRATVHNWLKQEAFAAAFDSFRQDYVESLRDQLRDLSALALDTLRRLLEDPATTPSVRLKAALAVLQRPVYPKQGWNLPEKVGTLAHERHLEDMAEIEAEYHITRRTDEIVKAGMREGHSRIDAHARNAPCPCGSGKKYKRCCGVNAPPLLRNAA